MHDSAKQAIKKMIGHYQSRLLFAVSDADNEKYVEKIIEWSERLEDKPNRADLKTLRGIQENIIEPMMK